VDVSELSGLVDIGRAAAHGQAWRRRRLSAVTTATTMVEGMMEC
jgi:hypothetical protein